MSDTSPTSSPRHWRENDNRESDTGVSNSEVEDKVQVKENLNRRKERGERRGRHARRMERRAKGGGELALPVFRARLAKPCR